MTLVYAQDGAASGAPGSAIPMIVMLVLILVVFYFVLIRPQKKKEKALQQMISNLKVGDEVASIGGIHGKIIKIKDNVFVLETGAGTTKSYVKIEKSAISRLVKEGVSRDDDDEDDEEVPEKTEEKKSDKKAEKSEAKSEDKKESK